MSIYKKLLTVQTAVKGLGKDKKSYGYDYVTGNKLLNFIKPILNEQGLILKQEISSVDTEVVNYSSKQGEKIEVLYKVWLDFTWVDVETGEKDVNKFFATGMNGFEKGLGSALTYAERYFLLKYFHIATDEDDIDNPERKNDAPITPKIKVIGEEKAKEMENYIINNPRRYKNGINDILAYFKIKNLKDLKVEDFERLVTCQFHIERLTA